jgi:hypothetical protein
MESINNSNNINIELAKKSKQFNKIKKVLKSALKRIISSSKKSKLVKEEICAEINDNEINELLERRMEDQQNLLNEQISGQQEASFCFVENEHGKFYWSWDVNRFVAVDRDLIAAPFCTTSFQQPQVQCY